MKRLIPLYLGVGAFVYYTILAAKDYTWLFVSGDSGDWLTAANLWIVPQPFGSPLYISLGHLVNLLPGHLPANMTIFLSALPAAITVALVYLIAKQMTRPATSSQEIPGLAAALIVGGANVFVSQATILEEYSLAVMFVVLGLYSYVTGHKRLMSLSLGAATAVHVIAAVVAVCWLLLRLREWREWRQAIAIYLVAGILPYGLIIYLFSTDAPRLFAGGLTWQALVLYAKGVTVVGSIRMPDVPVRFYHFFLFGLSSMGVAWFPIGLAIRSRSRLFWMLAAVIILTGGFYLVCLDPTVWTYLIYALPMLAILAASGLSRLSKRHAIVVLATTCALIAANAYFLNASALSQQDNRAQRLYSEIQQVPDGSAILITRGGWEAMAVFYAMSEGKDVAPVFLYTDNQADASKDLYLAWLQAQYGLVGQTSAEIVTSTDRPVYLMSYTPFLLADNAKHRQDWTEVFEVEHTDGWLQPVRGVKNVAVGQAK